MSSTAEPAMPAVAPPSRRDDVVELPLALEARAEPPVGETAALTAAVAQLPERQRSVFSLRELRGVGSRGEGGPRGDREGNCQAVGSG